MISFDNVIGVVGAAKGNFGFMIFGLVLSVILTGSFGNISCKLYSKTFMDCLCWFRFYSFSSTSISNWRFSRLRNFINQ